MDNGKFFIDSVFIVWTPFTRRASVLSDYIPCEIYFINHLIKDRGIIWRLFFWVDYLYKSARTLLFLIKKKPRIIFAQSPPSFCPMICMLYCTVFKSKLIIDCHDSTFSPPWISVPFYKKVLSMARAVIVHNKDLASFLKARYTDIRFLTLNDKLNHLDKFTGENTQAGSGKFFLVILIYETDEPAVELLEAIKQFLKMHGKNYTFKVTGNYQKRQDLFEKYETVDGIEFLGFIPTEEYDFLLKNAFGAITLTTRDRKQGCAVAEAVGAKIPLIVSDTETNRHLLPKGAIFTKSDVNSIKNAIEQFTSNSSKLQNGIKTTNTHWENHWQKKFKKLILLLN